MRLTTPTGSVVSRSITAKNNGSVDAAPATSHERISSSPSNGP